MLKALGGAAKPGSESVCLCGCSWISDRVHVTQPVVCTYVQWNFTIFTAGVSFVMPLQLFNAFVITKFIHKLMR